MSKLPDKDCCSEDQKAASSQAHAGKECHVDEGLLRPDNGPRAKKARFTLSNNSLLYSSLFALIAFYSLNLSGLEFKQVPWLMVLSAAVFELVNMMWWGIAIGVVMMSLLAKIPREMVIYVLGSKKGASGIVRATLAGVLLDLCSHGILLVASTLYERGVSIGQVMAFLIASPWNSFSFTLILMALVGVPWTLAFIVLSMVIAISTGLIFDALVKRQYLSANPNNVELKEDYNFWQEIKQQIKSTDMSVGFLVGMLREGLQKSKMVMKWILFGIILASLIRTFVTLEYFQNFFGPTLAGLGLTILAATIIEVCSEGSVPIAADLLTRANAPGNSFAFLMTGVSTDYTEIMVLKDTTGRWLIALLLPVLTVPQVVLIAWFMNQF